jgi:hypothetical protein
MQMRQVLQRSNSERSSIASTAKLLEPRPFAAPLPIEETAPSTNSSRFGNLLEISTLFSPRQQFPSVQPKLTIGEPGDQYEQEADRVAAEVVQKMNAPADSRSLDEGGNSNKPIQRSLIKPIAQRANQVSSPPIQRYPEFHNHLRRQLLAGDPAPQADFENRLNQARQGGSPLDKTLRSKVEPIMGADFSGVKIHTDAQADQLSRSIQAKAFTTGKDVFFRQGAYEPASRGGQELIAHELTHVIQQGSKNLISPVQTSLIQRAGETQAAEHTVRLNIRRGNRRGSVVDTGGRSQAKLIFVREFTNEIIHEVGRTLSMNAPPNLKKQIDKALKNRDRMKTYVAELARVGNCGEFAQMVFWHIVEHAGDTWVYEASMLGWTRAVSNYDHAFNITYDSKINDPNSFNLEKATVVDAWNNYTIQTLGQFLARNNPYGARLHKKNIRLHKVRKAEGEEILGSHVKGVILDITQRIYDREQAKIANNARYLRAGNSQGIFDFPRVNQDVQDKRRN